MTLESPGDMVIYRSRLNAKINRNFEVFTPTDFLAVITQLARDPTPTNRVTTWSRTRRTCSRTETRPYAARPECRSAPAHRRFRLGPGSDRACSRPVCARTAYPSSQNAVPQGQEHPRKRQKCGLTSRHPSVNIAPCLVRLKNQFSLTRAALRHLGAWHDPPARGSPPGAHRRSAQYRRACKN